MIVVPNVWDVLSARLVEQAGAKMIATSSAVVAWARGYRDGEALPLADVVDVATRIARGAKVPVSVDFERGYGGLDDISRLVDAGVSGVNLEDGGGDPNGLAALVEAVKRRHTRLFVNARTDLALRGRPSVSDLLSRASVFASAGADGFFVPGLHVPTEIEAVARGTSLPLNVMQWPGLPAPAVLRELGVGRLSVGAGLGEVAYAAARAAARDLLDHGKTGVFGEHGLSYPELQGLFPAPP